MQTIFFLSLFLSFVCPACAAVNWSQTTVYYPLNTVQRQIFDVLAVSKASFKMPWKATVRRVPRKNFEPANDVDLTIMLAEIKREI